MCGVLTSRLQRTEGKKKELLFTYRVQIQSGVANVSAESKTKDVLHTTEVLSFPLKWSNFLLTSAPHKKVN
jgi:hypothetical protein